MNSQEVTIWSAGTRMRGDLYRPTGYDDGGLRPAIVCCHGWAHPLREAVAATRFPEIMAAAGYFVLAFDYRGWGSSDGIPLVREDLTSDATKTAAPVEVVREVLNPIDWALDIRHAIDFIEGEPGVDARRIGLAGWSLGGGMVVWTAATDPRVRCVVAQAGAYDYRGQASDGRSFFPMWTPEQMESAAAEQARGGRGPGPIELDLRDWPPSAASYREGGQPFRVDPNVRFFSPIQLAPRISVPVMIIDAEKEWLWDIREHGEATSRAIASGGAASAYHVIPGIEHLGIYEPSSGANELARAWYERHLAREH